MRRISLLLFIFAFFPLEAFASSGGAERAAAESLYREATRLAQAGNFEAACPKYETSQKLDPALGTMLRLADCWDRVGRTASAWALFLEAETLSRKLGEVERQQIAKERANALEDRLTRILLVARFELPPGYQLEMEGGTIDPEVWASPLPVDPGKVTLKARAPGYIEQTRVFRVAETRELREISVPKLEKKPKEEPQVGPLGLAASSADKPKRSWQRPTGIVVGATGLASLAAGGVFAYLATTSYRSSLENCLKSDANQCTNQGVLERNLALKQADLSTVFFAAGGGLAALGLGLIVFSPKRHRGEEAPQVALIQLTPQVGPTGAGITLLGSVK